MALIFTLTATTMFLLAVEFLMRGFDRERDPSEQPLDHVGVAFVATVVWMALLAPLFYSYHV